MSRHTPSPGYLRTRGEKLVTQTINPASYHQPDTVYQHGFDADTSLSIEPTAFSLSLSDVKELDRWLRNQAVPEVKTDPKLLKEDYRHRLGRKLTSYYIWLLCIQKMKDVPVRALHPDFFYKHTSKVDQAYYEWISTLLKQLAWNVDPDYAYDLTELWAQHQHFETAPTESQLSLPLFAKEDDPIQIWIECWPYRANKKIYEQFFDFLGQVVQTLRNDTEISHINPLSQDIQLEQMVFLYIHTKYGPIQVTVFLDLVQATLQSTHVDITDFQFTKGGTSWEKPDSGALLTTLFKLLAGTVVAQAVRSNAPKNHHYLNISWDDIPERIQNSSYGVKIWQDTGFVHSLHQFDDTTFATAMVNLELLAEHSQPMTNRNNLKARRKARQLNSPRTETVSDPSAYTYQNYQPLLGLQLPKKNP